MRILIWRRLIWLRADLLHDQAPLQAALKLEAQKYQFFPVY
jgi:hypothetical protein